MRRPYLRHLATKIHHLLAVCDYYRLVARLFEFGGLKVENAVRPKSWNPKAITATISRDNSTPLPARLIQLDLHWADPLTAPSLRFLRRSHDRDLWCHLVRTSAGLMLTRHALREIQLECVLNGRIVSGMLRHSRLPFTVGH